MKVVINPERSAWKALLTRPVLQPEAMEKVVLPVMEAVRDRGDEAVCALTRQFDGVDLASLAVSEKEIQEAEARVDDRLKAALHVAKQNVEKFHKAQETGMLRVETMPGVHCYRKSVAIGKVGLYIPGGTAPLFSTVLMLAVPAKIAGCEEVVLCTPPDKEGKVHPVILYAAHLTGVTRIFKAGGAQAIAAMTFGTGTIPAVYKIFGPGNQYVTAAKQLAVRYGVAIDMPAGPSEVAVLADETAIPAFVAADLLSQAEHGTDSQVVLVTSSEMLVLQVKEAIGHQLVNLPRRSVAEKALENSLAIVITDTHEAIDLLNEYGAEHLILAVKDPWSIADRIVNAGSVFLGNYTPESAGDYASGTNHTLPTNGFARAYSGVSLDSFVKKITYQEISEEGMNTLGPVVETMAAAEQLEAHKNAVSVRLQYLKDHV